jgi:tetratricopeptide (TPR) repeat protein
MTTNTKKFAWLVLLLTAGLTFGCGGAKKGAKGGDDVEVGADGKPIISKEAREDFDKAAAAYKEAAKAGWNEKNCEKVAEKFADVAKEHGKLPEAMYNVGVVWRDCGDMKKAKAAFEKTLKAHPKNQLSMTHLAIIELEAGNQVAAEKWIKDAVGAGRNALEAVPAYTLAGALLREKAKKGDSEAYGKAQRSLRTALAIDSKYIAALFQLAMLYFDIAVQEKKPSYLTLASLVCAQAVKLDPEYAPVYYAMARIHLQKDELVKALNMFEQAFQKDSTMFESYMAFGAINLNFRGYEAAKMAFENAIRLKPKNYDAHMGLGVALRGLQDYEGAKAEYKKAAEIDPKRTDYIFNLGLLEMDYINDGSPAGYEKASKVFEKFLGKATAAHKKSPCGKKAKRCKKKSWYQKAEARIAACKDAADKIREAEKEMAELAKLQAEQEKAQKEIEEQMKKAKELEQKEAAGEAAKGAAVDEAALDAELDAEDDAAEAKAKEEAAAKKAEEEAKKAEEETEGEGGE